MRACRSWSGVLGLAFVVGCGAAEVDVGEEPAPTEIEGSAADEQESEGELEVFDVLVDVLGTDECNTTGECQEKHGSAATDCFDSASANSTCLCGSDPCTADQCDSTTECQSVYSGATDCLDSQSNKSVCMCGSMRCDSAGEPGPGPEPVDQCDTTDECQQEFGAQATDCLNSQSNDSVCMCGSTPCDDDVDPPPPPPPGACEVSGDRKAWHRVVLECDGPSVGENSTATFLDHRMDVTFSSGATSITVPGHFAADGGAANSGASNGSVWRAYFMPPAAGNWTYQVGMFKGSRAAVTNGGSPFSEIHGARGNFSVDGAGTLAKDLRTRGLLEHRSGQRYLQFRRNDEVFIDAGANSPENLLGYTDFDNTQKFDDAPSCKGILHSFAPHVGDWNSGDPTWKGGKGKALIGLVNYLSSKDVNAIYFLGMNVRGDGCDTYPWTSYEERVRFDVSKLDQWETVFEHMQRKGLMIHFMTQETENDRLLDGGDLGDTRRLYYREMISRFGHHPALQWNLGEENTNTEEERRSFANYIKATDPYNHPIFIHTFTQDRESVYSDLLGFENLDGPTMQIGNIPAIGSGDLYSETQSWIDRSRNRGFPWVVTVTEASGNDAPTPNAGVTSLQRVNYMWANVMAGGGGFEWYLKRDGDGHAYDLAVENQREFDALWEQSGYVSSFFTRAQRDFGVDLGELSPSNGLTSNGNDWVLADEGRDYIVFLRNGGSTNLTVAGGGQYTVNWFNPRSGAWTTRANIQGSGSPSLGQPPSEGSSDWVILVSRGSGEGSSGGGGGGGQRAEFVENNGYVVMEAESGGAPGEWSQASRIGGYTGSGYVTFNGNGICNGPAGSDTNFEFSVSSSGRRELRFRAAKVSHCTSGQAEANGVCSEAHPRGCERLAAPNGGQCPGNTCLRTDLSNDVFVSIYDENGNYVPFVNQPSAIGQGVKMFGGSADSFAWSLPSSLDLSDQKWPAQWDLPAGNYTLVVSGRSQQFSLDRLVLFDTGRHGFDGSTLTGLPETR